MLRRGKEMKRRNGEVHVHRPPDTIQSKIRRAGSSDSDTTPKVEDRHSLKIKTRICSPEDSHVAKSGPLSSILFIAITTIFTGFTNPATPLHARDVFLELRNIDFQRFIPGNDPDEL